MSWPVVPAAELMVKRGGSVNPGKFADETFELLSIPAFDKQRPEILKGSQIGSSKSLVEPNDILLSKIVPHIRRCWVVPPKGKYRQIGSGEWIIFRDERFDSGFLKYFLTSDVFHRQFMNTVAGVGGSLVRARPAEVERIKIPLPPLAEQKRIAAILDKADAIRRKRQRAIQLADEFLRAVFLDMFGDPVTNPKGWEVWPIGEICGCIVPGRDKPKSFTGSTPWITTNELNHLGITTKKEEFIGLTEEEIAEVKAKVVPAGSVLMTCVGDLGVISIAGDDMVINQQLHAFLPSDFVTPSFLSYALAWQKGYMLRMASSTTVPYMNKTICNSIPVIMPPIDLQVKFEKTVEKVTENRIVMAGFSSANLFESISQKAFSGEL